MPEKNCQWRFAAFDITKGGAIGPNEPMSENFKKNSYASLIRESIQNSLDVASSDEPVIMSFSLKSMNPSNLNNFFEIRNHIQGCIDFYPQNDNAKSIYQPMLDYIDSVQRVGQKFYYLKVSDSNTTGMPIGTGIEDTSSPFFAFVRAAGLSSKNSQNAGGSFGFGKAAYFYLSAMRSLIVSTKTLEGNYYFEGVTSLCTHKFKGQDFSNLGYYDNNGGLPVCDYDKIPNRFKRKDEENNEIGPGTDIYIMGVDLEGQTVEDVYVKMIKALLRNFWLAIYEKKLIVTIGDVKVDAIELPGIMNQYFPEENDESKSTEDYNPRPYLQAVINAESDKKHRLFKLDLEVESTNYGTVYLYLYRNKNGNDRVLFMRQPRMLVYSKRRHTHKGYYGVLVCKEGKVDELLRQAENPAHNEWHKGNLKGAYKQYSKLISEFLNQFFDLITNSVDELFGRSSTASLSIDGLNEYLYIPTSVEDYDEDDYPETEEINPTGEIRDEGTSATTVISNTSQTNPQAERPKTGRVVLPITTTVKKNEKGGLLSGHTKKKRVNPEGGEPGSRHIDQRNTEDPNGVKGHFKSEIKVRYRTFAQTVDNRTIHTVIIRSEREIENGRIDLLIAGEESDERIKIVETDKGTAQDNTVINLHILEGKNIIKVKFADNLKHALKLDAYEIK